MDDAPRWLSADEITAWLKLAAVLELLPAALDSQLGADAGLTHFDYFVLAMLSEAPEQTLRMSSLAASTNATLPRLSRVVSRLEQQGLLERRPCADDRRATDAALTPRGLATVRGAAPGHVARVRALVVDRLTAAQLQQLAEISDQILDQLDPGRKVFATDA